MWPRVVEIMTACWLALSPFIFRTQSDEVIVWADSLIALAIWILSGVSYWPRARSAHLAIIPLALGLILWGRLAEPAPPAPIHQNHIVVGLFLLMIAVIPSRASDPPTS